MAIELACLDFEVISPPREIVPQNSRNGPTRIRIIPETGQLEYRTIGVDVPQTVISRVSHALPNTNFIETRFGNDEDPLRVVGWYGANSYLSEAIKRIDSGSGEFPVPKYLLIATNFGIVDVAITTFDDFKQASILIYARINPEYYAVATIAS